MKRGGLFLAWGRVGDYLLYDLYFDGRLCKDRKREVQWGKIYGGVSGRLD